jgi:hypothetical protein
VLWRFKSPSQSGSLQRQNQPYYGFGWDALIIDFYKNGYITEFAPLSEVLWQGPEKVMFVAFDRTIEQFQKQFLKASLNLRGQRRQRMR